MEKVRVYFEDGDKLVRAAQGAAVINRSMQLLSPGYKLECTDEKVIAINVGGPGKKEAVMELYRLAKI